jgi:hypothetical protein
MGDERATSVAVSLSGDYRKVQLSALLIEHQKLLGAGNKILDQPK